MAQIFKSCTFVIEIEIEFDKHLQYDVWVLTCTLLSTAR
jgi:hypothetical protein